MSKGEALHTLAFGLFMFGFWLLLSGYFDALLLSLGVASVAIIVFVSHRMDIADHETHPLHLAVGKLTYFPWLCWQIVLANLDVAKAILNPKDGVYPTLLRVRASQKSGMGRVIYANSITLTPGTVTVDINEDILDIHSLTRGSAEGLLTGEMDQKVTAMMGPDEKPDPPMKAGSF